MKIKLFLSLLGSILFLGCNDTTSVGSNINPTLTNKEYDTEIEEESISTNIISHHQGIACLTCHAYPAKKADGEDFLSGGTIYTTLNGDTKTKYAQGYSIRIVLDTNLNLDYKIKEKRGSANSYSKNSALSSEYNFTAQVLNSNKEVVNKSATNSHKTSSHLNCNSCHTSNGNNGAPGRITF